MHCDLDTTVDGPEILKEEREEYDFVGFPILYPPTYDHHGHLFDVYFLAKFLDSFDLKTTKCVIVFTV